MSTIYQYLKDYLQNPSSFAARYRMSKKHNQDFHLEVDQTLLENGFDTSKTKMSSIFRFLETNDINCGICESFQYNKIDAFIALEIYNSNRIVFANKFYRTKHDSDYKNYFLKILRFFEPNFTFDNKDAGKILYDTVYPMDNKAKCSVCNINNVIFHDTVDGYGKYCSLECSRSVCKMTEETIKTATRNRMKTIEQNSKDPVWFANRHSRLSSATKKRYEDPEERLKQSNTMKDLIESGKFTPNITNTWTRWTSKIGNKKFRSNFDALFHIYSEVNDMDYEYEKLRIPYYFEGKKHIYIVDYISRKTKTAIEIKPSNLTELPRNIEKERSLKQWCSNNGYSYKIITETFLKEFFLDYYHKCKNDDYFDVLNKIKTSYDWESEHV